MKHFDEGFVINSPIFSPFFSGIFSFFISFKPYIRNFSYVLLENANDAITKSIPTANYESNAWFAASAIRLG